MKVNSGFSLVELMVVITIVAILMGIGVPSYRYVTNSNRISAEVNGLLGDLQFARSEALKEGGTVTVCPPDTTGKVCGNSSTWDQGWIVTSPNVTPGLLRVQKPFATTKDSFVGTLGQTAISFDRNGFASAQPVQGTGNSIVVKLMTTPNNHAWTRCVETLVGGAIATEKYGQNGCTGI
jgi:type IV fimbrial biogenesis protein FimT